MRHAIIAGLLAVWPLAGLAEDAALVLGTERYEQLGRVPRADEVVDAAEALQGLGFAVQALENGRAGAVGDALGAFAADAEGAERLVVALAGRFVHDGGRSWYLTAEAAPPGLFDLGDSAVSVDSLLRVLGTRPGRAVLLLGVEDDPDTPVSGPFLRAGPGDPEIPQGVTVLRAEPRAIARFLQDDLAVPGADLGALIAANPDISASGFVPVALAFLPEDLPEPAPVVVATPNEDDLTREARAWDSAVEADTAEAYRAYLNAYPAGRFATEAEEMIAEILAEPNRAARLAEEALELSRADQREIQEDLTVLGYNTRGVDGIFGPGTRGAITNWQQQNGYPQTAYLSRDQINRLHAQAERRRAEQAAEAARAEAEAARLDRVFWDETGAKGDEAGYRAYLDRYPGGIHASIAADRLAEIDAARAAAAAEEERADWAQAQDRDTVAAYQAFLNAWPDGQFAERATERIGELQGPRASQTQVEAARAAERTLGLTGIRAQLLELRLADAGFDPGRADGVLDDDFRAALGDWQAANGVPPTGFVDQLTLVTLMAGALGVEVDIR